MTRKELNILLAAVLTTLVDHTAAPRSIVMLGLNTGEPRRPLTLDEYLLIERILLDGDLVTEQHDILRITAKGAAIAKEINSMIAEARATEMS
jgi:hypothetical protein